MPRWGADGSHVPGLRPGLDGMAASEAVDPPDGTHAISDLRGQLSVVPPSPMTQNPADLRAWDSYRTLAHACRQGRWLCPSMSLRTEVFQPGWEVHQIETRSHTKTSVSPGAITRPAPRSP
jgi:hypothetical protein